MSTPAERKKKIEAEVIKAFKVAEATCTLPWVLDYSRKLKGTSITFQQLMMILAGVGWIIIAAISAYLVAGHLRYWCRRKEQRQIIRIILFVPTYALIAFFSIIFDHIAGFLAAYGQLTSGIALNAMFLLYIEIASPQSATREEFFDNLERKWYSGKTKSDEGSLRWFRVLNIMAFQLFITRIATVVAINVLYATTCPLSTTRAHGQTAITVIQGISTGIALWACLLLERRLHTKMQEHKALFKLFSVKAVVILDAIQVIIFPTIAENRVFRPSPPWPVSWNDFAFALPNFLLVMEMAIVSITLLWAFDVSR